MIFHGATCVTPLFGASLSTISTHLSINDVMAVLNRVYNVVCRLPKKTDEEDVYFGYISSEIVGR